MSPIFSSGDWRLPIGLLERGPTNLLLIAGIACRSEMPAGSVPTWFLATVPEVPPKFHQAIVHAGGVTQVWAQTA